MLLFYRLFPAFLSLCLPVISAVFEFHLCLENSVFQRSAPFVYLILAAFSRFLFGIYHSAPLVSSNSVLHCSAAGRCRFALPLRGFAFSANHLSVCYSYYYFVCCLFHLASIALLQDYILHLYRRGLILTIFYINQRLSQNHFYCTLYFLSRIKL